MPYCPKCGHQVNSNSSFCTECGFKLSGGSAGSVASDAQVCKAAEKACDSCLSSTYSTCDREEKITMHVIPEVYVSGNTINVHLTSSVTFSHCWTAKGTMSIAEPLLEETVARMKRAINKALSELTLAKPYTINITKSKITID